MKKYKICFPLLLILWAHHSLADFSVNFLSNEEIKRMQDTKVWHKSCPVNTNRLRVINVSYIDFDGNEHHDGKLVVMDAVADNVVGIFKNLYEKNFPLSHVKLLDEYKEGEAAAIADNNSYALDCARVGDENGEFTLESYGVVLAINPQQNPLVTIKQEKNKTVATYTPKQNVEYVNRLSKPGKYARPGMAEEVKEIFNENGLTVWGGEDLNPIDYRHFQIKRELAELLAVMSPEFAKSFFVAHTKYYREHKQELTDYMVDQLKASTGVVKNLKEYYLEYKSDFISIFRNLEISSNKD